MQGSEFRRFVIEPTLRQLGLFSEAATRLVLGTALHESGGLRHIDQIVGPGDVTLGPAFGVYQIEPATHDDLYENYLRYRRGHKEALLKFRAPEPNPHLQLVTNLAYATAVCRLIYYRAPARLPAADDLPGLAAYWKTYYNTPAGAGTVAHWLSAWRAHGED